MPLWDTALKNYLKKKTSFSIVKRKGHVTASIYCNFQAFPVKRSLGDAGAGAPEGGCVDTAWWEQEERQRGDHKK